MRGRSAGELNVKNMKLEVQHAHVFVGKDASSDERSRLNNSIP
jgi:hypothetical protein